MKKRYKILIIIAIIVILLGVGIKLMVDKLDDDVQTILNTEIIDIDLSDVSNGTYTGTFNEAMACHATVEVTVLDGQITNIVIIEHVNGQGEPAEVIVDDIINQQSVMIDDIAGATYSSRVIKLAVIDALGGNDGVD